MADNLEGEVRVMTSYSDELESLLTQLESAEGREEKELRKKFAQKLQAYEQVVNRLKEQMPGERLIRVHEAHIYQVQAALKIAGRGFFRKGAQSSGNLGVAMAAHLIANAQEKAALKEVLTLLDKSLAIEDAAFARVMKASIYKALGQKDAALREVEYVINKFPDDESYVDARTLKDELEVKKRGPCFVATACYGDYDHPDVVVFRRFRDQTLRRTSLGRCLVQAYYKMSPPLACWLEHKPYLSGLVRRLLLQRIATSLRHRRR